MRVIDVTNTNKIICFWKDYIEIFRENKQGDNVSILKFRENESILMCDSNIVHMIYYNEKENLLYQIEEKDILSFVDNIEKGRKHKLSFQEHLEIIFNILYKKTETCSLKELKNKKVNPSILQYIDIENYKEEYDFIFNYLFDTK